MEYKIREIEARDNKAVENVIRTCLIEFGANHEGTAWADPDLGRFSEIYNKEGHKYWVAEDENGKMNLSIKDVGGELTEARGTGISHKLIQIALEYAKDYYGRCYLETLDNMIAAQKFYEKYDFVRTKPLVQTEHFAGDVCYVREL